MQMIERLPHLHEDAPLPVDYGLTTKLIDNGFVSPTTLLNWTRFGTEDPEQADDMTADLAAGALENQDLLTSLQNEGLLAAGFQQGVGNRDRSDYVHIWIPGEGETPEEYFRRSTGLGTHIDHRIYFSYEPQDTQSVARRIIELSIDHSEPLYFQVHPARTTVGRKTCK